MEDEERRRIELLCELHDGTLEGPATTKQGTPPAVITENITQSEKTTRMVTSSSKLEKFAGTNF